MTNSRNLIAVCGALILSAAISHQGYAQILWSAEVGSYSNDDNWDDGAVPDASLFEIGEVNNGGTAIVDDVTIEPAGIVLGNINVNVGSMTIQNGGSLTVSSEPGSVRVGVAGEGYLSVLSGGTLNAQSLTLGGSILSTVELESGAEVTINGATNLARNTRIIGPDVNFSTQTLNFNNSVTAEINSSQHTPISVAANATLNGNLFVDFNNHTPTNGDSWSLLDAGNVAGNFDQITHSKTLPAGTGLIFSTEDGGANGTLAKLSVETQLVLAIDQVTGQSTIENRTNGSTVDFDGYLVTSGAEVLSPATWNSLDGQGVSGWVEANPSSIHIGELNLNDSLALGPVSSAQLGGLYDYTPTVFGEAYPEVTFEYYQDGETKQGQVDFTGLNNNVVLVVDPDSGAASIQNQSAFDIEIDGYLITSLSGSLSESDWVSLEASGQGDWAEGNPSPIHIGELNLTSSLELDAVSAPISIGSPFDSDAAGVQRDLTFEIHLADGETVLGVVEYGSVSGMSPLDCNGDGVVNAADLDCTCATGNQLGLLNELNLLPGDLDGDGTVAFADFLVLSGNFGQNVDSYTQGDIDCDGTVAFADFLVLSGNFGQSSGAAASVPEPSGLSLLVFGLLFFVRRRTRSIS